MPSLGKAAMKLFGVKSADDQNEPDDGELPFGLRSHFLSESHAMLYRALTAALAAEAVVFARVRLADFLYVSGGGKDLQHAIKIDRKYVDFLLCDPFTMQPLAAIELTNPGDKKSRPRDEFVTRALKSASIPLVEIQSHSSFPVGELRKALLPKVQS